jgi:hypothetical protein
MYFEQSKTHFPQFCQIVMSYRIPSEPYVPVPCRDDEIEAMEAVIGIPFPAAYKEFLRWMGHSAGSFMDSHIFDLDTLHRNRGDALELMEDNGCSETLPDDAIVFAWGNQGYYFSFIRSSEGDDPPVHNYDEGKGFTWNVDPTLDAFINRYMNVVEDYTLQQLAKSN